LIAEELFKASNQIRGKDYKGAIKTCKRILRYPLKKDKVCADTLGYLGNASGVEKSSMQLIKPSTRRSKSIGVMRICGLTLAWPALYAQHLAVIQYAQEN